MVWYGTSRFGWGNDKTEHAMVRVMVGVGLCLVLVTFGSEHGTGMTWYGLVLAGLGMLL